MTSWMACSDGLQAASNIKDKIRNVVRMVHYSINSYSFAPRVNGTRGSTWG